MSDEPSQHSVGGPESRSREVGRLPAFDGEELYLEVMRPKAAGRFPVILEASPYHGTLADRDGTRILPEPRDADRKSLGLTGYFAPRGYGVVMMDLRGTGRSAGCLDHLGAKGVVLPLEVDRLAQAVERLRRLRLREACSKHPARRRPVGGGERLPAVVQQATHGLRGHGA